MKERKYNSREIASKYLEFFKAKDHAIIPSAPLVPEEDSPLLFNIAGMQPLMPYFLGKKHPGGVRIANIQKCLRTIDINEVGDDSHCTFFEMLGNWSLGDYFKKESIYWSWEFLTSHKWLGLDPRLISVTVFEGNNDAPRDNESAKLWGSLGLDYGRIAFMGSDDNWWAVGETGPCGPDTEIFYWINKGLPPVGSNKKTDPENWMEIWNNVFMEFNRLNKTTLERLPKRNVDTGMGLERITVALNRAKNIYQTDLFIDVMEKILSLVTQNKGFYQERSGRIIADHLRAAIHLIGDGVLPSNIGRGYVLRRLIRRAIREAYKMKVEKPIMSELGRIYIKKFKNIYISVDQNQTKILEELQKEEAKFTSTIKKGIIEFEKISRDKNKEGVISGKEVFYLFETFGFPLEMTAELASENNLAIDKKGYEKALADHQEKSRANKTIKFKGGLADRDSKEVISLHTACHLMLAGIRWILGNDIYQAGSNITPDRLRFDFNYPKKLTSQQIKKIEDFVNRKIAMGFSIKKTKESKKAARTRGVMGSFWNKYPDLVQIYKIVDKNGEIVSEEICGGPHVDSSKNMGKFRIIKEESSGSGVRRIKAILQKEKILN